MYVGPSPANVWGSDDHFEDVN